MTVLPRNARASNSQRGLWFQSDQKVVPELYPRRFYGLNPVVLEGYWTFGLNLNASKQNLEYWTSPKGFVIEMQVILSPFFHIWYTGTTSILSGKHRPLLGFAFTNTRKVRKVFAEGAQWNDTVSSRLWKFNVVTYGSETHYWSLCVLHESESTYIYIYFEINSGEVSLFWFLVSSHTLRAWKHVRLHSFRASKCSHGSIPSNTRTEGSRTMELVSCPPRCVFVTWSGKGVTTCVGNKVGWERVEIQALVKATLIEMKTTSLLGACWCSHQKRRFKHQTNMLLKCALLIANASIFIHCDVHLHFLAFVIFKLLL